MSDGSSLCLSNAAYLAVHTVVCTVVAPVVSTIVPLVVHLVVPLFLNFTKSIYVLEFKCLCDFLSISRSLNVFSWKLSLFDTIALQSDYHDPRQNDQQISFALIFYELYCNLIEVNFSVNIKVAQLGTVHKVLQQDKK